MSLEIFWHELIHRESTFDCSFLVLDKLLQSHTIFLSQNLVVAFRDNDWVSERGVWCSFLSQDVSLKFVLLDHLMDKHALSQFRIIWEA